MLVGSEWKDEILQYNLPGTENENWEFYESDDKIIKRSKESNEQ